MAIKTPMGRNCWSAPRGPERITTNMSGSYGVSIADTNMVPTAPTFIIGNARPAKAGLRASNKASKYSTGKLFYTPPFCHLNKNPGIAAGVLHFLGLA
jgi:hypothetical protein